ncbi:MAG TPA: RidA family protein [Candidatus Binatia bacterium]|jgi:enamine deaminase RidA (YjgF/YER057c/UK114 family)
MKLVVMLALMFLSFARTAQGQELKKEFLDPVPEDSRSTAVKVKGGTMLFLAGHTASQPQRDADLGNFDAQFKSTFDKIKNTLAAAGGTVDDIVSMSVFITDLRLVPQFSKLAKDLFKKNFPAVTYVEVSHLARPQSLIEVQPIAVIP